MERKLKAKRRNRFGTVTEVKNLSVPLIKFVFGAKVNNRFGIWYVLVYRECSVTVCLLLIVIT